MEVLFDGFVQFATEIIIILIGTLCTVVLNKVKQWVDTLKKKDQTGIVEMVCDAVVAYCEAELKDSKGLEKRNWAVDKAIAILLEKGIVVPKDEVIAGIEQAVMRMNENKK